MYIHIEFIEIFICNQYYRKNFVEYDPSILACSCLFLASKIEECPIGSNQLFEDAKKISDFKYGKESPCLYVKYFTFLLILNRQIYC